jgi:hypothetical protein
MALYAKRSKDRRIQKTMTDHPTSHVMQLVVFYFSKRFPGRGDSLKKEALKRTTSLWASPSAESFSRYFQGYNIRFPFDRSPRVHVGCQKNHGSVAYSHLLGNLIASTSRGMPRDPKRGEAQGHRRCRLCDPASGQCRRLCVRPSGPKSGDKMLSTCLITAPTRASTGPSRQQPSAVANNSSLIPPPTQFPPPAAE